MVCAASYFPTGWEPTLAATGSGDSRTALQLASCLQVGSTVLTHGPDVASADSPDFATKDDETQVHNSVTIGTSDDAVDQGMRVLEGPGWPACVNTVIKATIQATPEPSAVKITGVTTNSLIVTPLLDQTIATRTRLNISVEGQTESVYVDLIVMRKSRVVELLYLIQTNSPFNKDLEQQFMTTASNRVIAAHLS
jgi:hypothetical protein